MKRFMGNKHLAKLLRGAACLLFWLAVWWGLALALGRAIVLPTPPAVARRLFSLLSEGDFLLTCLTSLGRIFAGLLIGIAAGALLAAASAASRAAETVFGPLVSVVKATPVASVIILMLFLLGKSVVPTVAAALLAIPIVYGNVGRGIRAVPTEAREVAKIYGFRFGKRLRYCILPSVLPYFSASCRSALGLSWKAGIAAEVICTPKHSIGGKLYDAKIYLETEDLFAWTVVVILLSILIEKLLLVLLERIFPKGGDGRAVS